MTPVDCHTPPSTSTCLGWRVFLVPSSPDRPPPPGDFYSLLSGPYHHNSVKKISCCYLISKILHVLIFQHLCCKSSTLIRELLPRQGSVIGGLCSCPSFLPFQRFSSGQEISQLKRLNRPKSCKCEKDISCRS